MRRGNYDSRDERAAAKHISDWGSEGVQSAARLVGDKRAQQMLKTHETNIKNISESSEDQK